MLKILKADWIDQATTLRRDLHKIPEEGLKEYKTRQYIIDYLKKFNISILENSYETAVVAVVGPVQGPAIAFRADMDALVVKEETDVDFKSEHPDMMHACGHDGHMTILLLFAQYLKSKESYLKRRVVLIFQPAEEGPGGADGIVKTGLFKEMAIQEVYGLHLYPGIQAHQIGIKAGPFMAQTSEFTITLHGESAHGAQPHRGTDAIVAVAQLITSLQTIVSRRLSPLEPAVVTIGKLVAGERLNIIAKRADLDGTMRSFSPTVHQTIQDEMRQIAEGVAVQTGCKVDVEFRDMYPAVINNEDLTTRSKLLLEEVLQIVPMEPQMLAEDFSYYQKEVPGLFFFLGTQNIERGFVHPLHHASFNFEEEVLVTGLEAFAIICFGEDYA